MARGWHSLQFKVGPRTIGRVELSCDPGDPKDFGDQVKGWLKDHHLDHEKGARVLIHDTSGKYLREVHLK